MNTNEIKTYRLIIKGKVQNVGFRHWFSDLAISLGLNGGFLVHLISIPLFIIDPLFVSLFEYILILTASIFINLAMLFATTAFRIAQKHYASVFPLVYLQVLWSSLIGIYIFNEYMDIFAYLGAFLIVLSGIIAIPSQIKQLKDSIK